MSKAARPRHQLHRGGYCTLYSEGAKLKGRAGFDGRIGAACQKVYDDEFGHMMYDVIGVEMDDMTGSDWEELTEVTCQILRLRLVHAQCTVLPSGDR